jgi:hypothetical protein
MKLVWKNLDSTKARPAYGKHFSLKWVLQWVKKKAGNQGGNNQASKTKTINAVDFLKAL